MFCVLSAAILCTFAKPFGQEQVTPYGKIGYYGDATCFQGDSSRYYGTEIGVCFSPFRFIEAGIGFNLMSGNDQTFTFVNGKLGLFSPLLWKLRAQCGISAGLQVTAPPEYWWDCDWPGRDKTTGGWLLPYCGLGYMFGEGNSGYSFSIDSRIFFAENEIRRMSLGVILSKSIYNSY